MTEAVLGLSLVALFLIGVPIALSLGVAAGLAMLAGGLPLVGAAQRIFAALDSFPLAAIPFFMLSGGLMERAGISQRLVAFAQAMVGHRSGGLAMVTVLSAMFFAAISGSSAATTAAIGTILIPAMARRGYPLPFATATQAASGELGVIIPPSIPLIIFALTAGVPVSIGDLFAAGIVPGLLIGLSLMLLVRLLATRGGFGAAEPRPPRGARRSAARDAVLALVMPVMILGGIYGGVFTPTEAAVTATFYALAVGLLIYRSLRPGQILDALRHAVMATIGIFLLIAAASLYGWVLSANRVPETIAGAFASVASGRITFLLMVNVLLILVGCVLETGAAIIILAPILTPVAVSFGVDPTHFGIVMIVNLAVGMTTPPVGVNLFVACQIAGLPIERLIRSMIPFYAVLLADLVVITLVPPLSLTLPRLGR